MGVSRAGVWCLCVVVCVLEGEKVLRERIQSAFGGFGRDGARSCFHEVIVVADKCHGVAAARRWIFELAGGGLLGEPVLGEQHGAYRITTAISVAVTHRALLYFGIARRVEVAFFAYTQASSSERKKGT